MTLTKLSKLEKSLKRVRRKLKLLRTLTKILIAIGDVGWPAPVETRSAQ